MMGKFRLVTSALALVVRVFNTSASAPELQAKDFILPFAEAKYQQLPNIRSNTKKSRHLVQQLGSLH